MTSEGQEDDGPDFMVDIDCTKVVKPESLERLEGRTIKRSLDWFVDILDEIALEGLDGITLQALWERLKLRPGFKICTDTPEAKTYIWKCIRRAIGIKIMELPTPRENLRIFDRSKSLDERGNPYEPLWTDEDIYVYAPVDEKKSRIRGSCPTFHERKNIKAEAKKLNYKAVVEKYGNRLVLVASQKMREKAIFPRDSGPEVELTIIQYCIVERVARARYLGESTRGKVSLNVMKIDPKSSFYQRKLLIKKNIITKQTSTMKFGENRVTSLISILHIPRFYNEFETLMSRNMKRAFNYLKAIPTHREETAKLKTIFGKHTIRSVLDLSDVFLQSELSYAELNPGILEREQNPVKKESHRRKMVKVVNLVNPSLNFSQYYKTKIAGKEDFDAEPVVPDKVVFKNNHRNSQTSVTYKAMAQVMNSVYKGTTLREISDADNLTHLDARTACRYMTRLKLVATVVEDLKKTKVHRFVWYKYKKAGLLYQKSGLLEREKLFPTIKMLNFTEPRPPPRTQLQFWTLVEGSDEPQLMGLTPNLPELSFSGIGKQPKAIISGAPTSTSTSTSSYTLTIPVVTLDSAEDVPDSYTIVTIQDPDAEPEKGQDSITSEIPGPSKATPKLKRANISTCPKKVKVKAEAEAVHRMDEISSIAKTENVESVTVPELEPESIPVGEFPAMMVTNLHFTKGEAVDFYKIEGREDISFSYETSGGWKVLLEPADVKVSLTKTQIMFNSKRNLDRAKFVIDLVYKYTLVLGFQQILRGIRKHELQFKERDGADRRSLYRILKQLQVDKKIQMWRISVSNGMLRKVCSAFTPGDITENSPLLVKAVDALIDSVIRRAKLSKDERKGRQKKLKVLKKTVAPPVKIKTTKQAKRGPKRKKSILPIPRTKKPEVTPLPAEPAAASAADPIAILPTPAKKKVRKYDEIDKQALARMRGQRGDWTSEEDLYALCLFIASVLFIPRYNFAKVFIFNAPQIRDIMHERLEESRSKTSCAIRRRLHFLMKTKGFYARYQFYLNKALEDKVLRNDILSKHVRKDRTGKTFYEIPVAALIEVFEYLLKLFQPPDVKTEQGLDTGDGSTAPMTSVQYQDANRIKRKKGAKATEKLCPEDAEDIKICEEFYDKENPIKGKRKKSSRFRRGFVLRKLRKRDPIVVDGKCDPKDLTGVIIWTARTSLLSLILSGGTLSESNSFLDCIPDKILDFVVQNLRCLSITTIAKPENRFTLSAVMKRKLHTHVNTQVYRSCQPILQSLREGVRYECSKKFNIQTLYIVLDFASKTPLNFEIKFPDSFITVNEEWAELFASVNLDEIDLRPPKRVRHVKKAAPPPEEVKEEPLDLVIGSRAPGDTESPESDPSTTLKRKATDDQDVKSQECQSKMAKIDEENSKNGQTQTEKNSSLDFEEMQLPLSIELETENLGDVNLTPGSTEPQATKSAPPPAKVSPPLPYFEGTPFDSLLAARRKYTPAETILAFNEIFKRKASRVIEDEETSTCSSLDSCGIPTLDFSNHSALNLQHAHFKGKKHKKSLPKNSGKAGRKDQKASPFKTPQFKLTEEFREQSGSSTGEGNEGGQESYPKPQLADLEISPPVADSKADTQRRRNTDGKVKKCDSHLRKFPKKGRVGIGIEVGGRKRGQKRKSSLFDYLNDEEDLRREGFDDDPSVFIKGKMTNKTLRALRSKFNATQSDNRLIEKDFFCVNLPEIFPSFHDSIDKMVYNETQPKNYVSYLKDLLIKNVSDNWITAELLPEAIEETLGRYLSLYKFIDIFGDVGVTIPFLLKKFDRQLVSTGARYLMKCNYIYLVGVKHRRLVCGSHAQRWTLSVPTAQGLPYTERVIMRPWITTSGQVNWTMVIQVFATLLGWLNSHPSVGVHDLCSCVKPLLSRVEVFLLIEAMVHMDFVKLYAMDVSHRNSLFSDPICVKKHTKIDAFLDMESLCVEMKRYGTTKFVDLQNSLNPAKEVWKIPAPAPIPTPTPPDPQTPAK